MNSKALNFQKLTLNINKVYNFFNLLNINSRRYTTEEKFRETTIVLLVIQIIRLVLSLSVELLEIHKDTLYRRVKLVLGFDSLKGLRKYYRDNDLY